MVVSRDRLNQLKRFLSGTEMLQVLALFANSQELTGSKLAQLYSKTDYTRRLVESHKMVSKVKTPMSGPGSLEQTMLVICEHAAPLADWLATQDLHDKKLAGDILKSLKEAVFTSIRVQILILAYENNGVLPSKVRIHGVAPSMQSSAAESLKVAGVLIQQEGLRLAPMGSAVAQFFM